MCSQPIEWIVFDLGGVVVHFSGERMFQAMEAHTGLPSEAARLALEASGVWQDLGIGRIMDAEFFRHVRAAFPHHTLADQDIRSWVNSILISEQAEVVAVMRQLTEQHKLACLSNTIDMHWQFMHASFPAMRLFKVCLASHLLKARKPDRSIFDRAAAQLKAAPAACLLIDDLPENVAGALRCGWDAIHFTGPSALLNELRRRGLYTSIID